MGVWSHMFVHMYMLGSGRAKLKVSSFKMVPFFSFINLSCFHICVYFPSSKQASQFLDFMANGVACCKNQPKYILYSHS